jgi:threonine/homoserine/homoserine lactone efflux protein
MIVDPVFKGILTGLILSISLGATFFMLVETSITRGLKAALAFDLGVFLSDLLCVVISYFFAAEIMHRITQNIYVGLFGGVAFIGFGVNYMFDRKNAEMQRISSNQSMKLILRGFFINTVNPSVFVFWLGTLAVALTQFKFTGKEIVLYFASALSVVVSLDILKIYFACWLRTSLTYRIIRILSIFSGSLLILLGIVVIISKIKAI